MESLQPIFRWLHIIAGIAWIGLLYFFNFVNGPFAATMDGDTKKKVVPELMPRALYWFRWGAAWTWGTGVLLLLLVFYHGRMVFDDPETKWSAVSIACVAVTFLGFIVYDILAKSIADIKILAAIGFILIAGFVYCLENLGGFGYRSYSIHLGVLFGTIMAGNVWMRIWPSQKKIIAAVKAGTPPDPKIVALAGSRSRHNTYLSVPLVWTMINMHTVLYAGNWLYLVAVVAIGWLIVNLFYKQSTQVKGF
jgi:uncharacterized membrane protein